MIKTYKEGCTTVTILGQPYRVLLCPRENDSYFDKANVDGYCEQFTHEIVVCSYSKDWETVDRRAVIEEIIAHEVVHAYMYESGLGANWEHKQFGQEETTVDWIAYQVEKIHTTLQDVYSKLEKIEVEDNNA